MKTTKELARELGLLRKRTLSSANIVQKQNKSVVETGCCNTVLPMIALLVAKRKIYDSLCCSESSEDQIIQIFKLVAEQQFAYLIIIDFESTCWKDEKFKSQEIMQLVLCHVAAIKCVPIRHHSADYIFWSVGIIEFIFSHFENRVLHKPVLQEIVGVEHFITVEFPAVLLNTRSGEIESEFHYYVQPQEQPILSSFCTELTGITQDQVDDGIPISLCLKKFCHWLDKIHREKHVVCNGQTDGRTTCTIVTWSDWDLGVCLQYECKRKQLLKPVQLTSWIDLRATYRKFYDRKPNGLNGALQDLGIEFQGREHSGLDDSRNTAKLAYRMIQDGCVMKVTKTLKTQENVPSKTPSVIKHFLPATRSTPPRNAKKVSPTKSTDKSPKQNRSNSNTSTPVRGKSRIPRPVGVSKSEEEQNSNLEQTPTKSFHTLVQQENEKADSDTKSPAMKRRKLIAINSPKVKCASVGAPKAKTNGKLTKKISPTKVKSSDIYIDPISCDSKPSNLRQSRTNGSANPGLKEQDLNVKVSTASISSNTGLSSGKDKHQSSERTFKRPLSPSHNKTSGLVKSPVSFIKPRINSVVNNKFQTSTPKVPINPPQNFSKSFAPSPINSVNSCSAASNTGLKTPPSTPVNKPAQQSSLVTPTPSLSGSTNSRTTVFKTPSPIMASRNSVATNSGTAMFKTPSPVTSNTNSNVNSSSVFKTPSVGSAMKCTPPLCNCGRRSKRRMVQSPGQNTGRFFFSCSVRHSAASKSGCDFFKWENSFNTTPNSSLTSKKTGFVSKQFTPVSGASFKNAGSGSYKKNLGMRTVNVSSQFSLRV